MNQGIADGIDQIRQLKSESWRSVKVTPSSSKIAYGGDSESGNAENREANELVERYEQIEKDERDD